MDLVQLLESARQEILDEATQSLTRARLAHYAVSGEEQNRQRLTTLYDLALQCIARRNLLPMVQHGRGVARQRFDEGFNLQEVQTAFNVLEEAIWKRITTDLEPPSYPEAFGLASTVLGAGKQALAVEYVSLASQKRDFHSLDLSALFRGTT